MGIVKSDALAGGMDYWVIHTTVDIAQTGVTIPVEQVNPTNTWPITVHGRIFPNAVAYNLARTQQKNFDILIDCMSMQAQPIIIGHVESAEESTPVFGIPETNALGSDDTVTVNTVRFAIEHIGAWDSNGGPLAALKGVLPFVFDLDDPSNNNIYAVKSEAL